ncbi:MAG: hypothetical protein ABL971_06100 [Vicinamibacterales bacterium]
MCNVAYDRRQLNAIGLLWATQANEPTVHDALRSGFGDLWLLAESEVVMRRSVGFAAALQERYAFGRIFAYRRLDKAAGWRRWFYVAVAPALPVLLLGRLIAKGLGCHSLRRSFIRAFPPLAAMVLWWSWGEWVGYLTARPPRVLTLASDRESLSDE